jgi:transposase
MKNTVFQSCLTDAQWAGIEPHLPKPSKKGRPRTRLRWILDAIFYHCKTGSRSSGRSLV